MQLAQAQTIAQELIDGPSEHYPDLGLGYCDYCERIQIAGSIRRQKPEVKDIELVYLPRIQLKKDLFGQVFGERDLINGGLGALRMRRILDWDTKIKRNGPKYKRLVHLASGMVVEIFRADPDNWGLILALRTGPADFNKRLVTSTVFGGAMHFNMRMREGYLWRQGQRLNTPTEASFFRALNLPCWPPAERTLARLTSHLQETSA